MMEIALAARKKDLISTYGGALDSGFVPPIFPSIFVELKFLWLEIR